MGRLLVFDLDGTLVDSAPDLLATLAAIMRRHGFKVPADVGLRDGIGHGARHLIEFALHSQRVEVDAVQLDSMYRDFLEHYEAHICESTQLYPGVERLLDRFAAERWRFAVCTNKLAGMSRRLLGELGIAGRFAAICGSDTFATRKPDPAHLLMTIAAARAKPENSVMVGDSRTDLDTARAADVPFVGVSFGYTPMPMAELRPDLLIDDFDDLLPDDLLPRLARAVRLSRSEAIAASGA